MVVQRAFCVALLLLATCGTAGVVAADGDAVDDSTIRIDQEYRQLDERGVVGVTFTYHVGDDISAVRTRLGENVTVASTAGITVQRDGGDRWLAWDGRTERPSATLHVRVNRTNDRFGGYDTYDAGDWAFVPALDYYTRYWADHDTDPTLVRTRSVDGEGIAGTGYVYIGPFEQTSRTVDGETIRIVEIADADERNLEARADALAFAHRRLDVGGGLDDDERGTHGAEVTAFVVPDPIRRGGQASDTDFFVHENSPLDTWFHEYVHTRQRYRTDRSTRWTTEAVADYYGHVLAWEYSDRYRYDRVQYVFDRGETDRSTLSRPSTWNGTSDYVKGATVVAMLDARIRQETDGNATFQDVFRRLNRHQGPLEHGTVRDSNAAVAGTSLDEYFSLYVYGRQSPSTDAYLAARGVQSDLSITTAVRNDTTGRVEITVRNEGPDRAVTPTLLLNASAEYVDLGGTHRLHEGRTSLESISPNQSRTIVARMYAPREERVEETVSIAVASASGDRANETVAVEYGRPETTATPTAAATSTPARTDEQTPTVESAERTPAGTPIETVAGPPEYENDDLLAGFGVLVGIGLVVLAVLEGVLNALLGFLWRPVLANRTVYHTAGIGVAIAVASAIVFAL